MKLTVAKTAKEQKDFLRFRRSIYSGNKRYIDDNYFMLCEIFSAKLNFNKSIKYYPVNVMSDEGGVLCQGVIVYAPRLPGYVQLCFFESLPHAEEAVKMLCDIACEYGRRLGCRKLVVGLNGHVNYGLGLQASHFDERNSFSSPGNPMYYPGYFRKAGFDEIRLNSYLTDPLEDPLSKYANIIKRLKKNYSFRKFDLRRFDEDSKIYTDLNNLCFSEHPYYYKREYEDDKEMLKELFMFMKEDSIIYAYREDEPVGFIMWYPDFNELAARGESFGTVHFFRNKLKAGKIKTAKVMEYGVLEKYRGRGLPMGLINSAYQIIKRRGFTRVETSWIMEDNEDSNSFCRATCGGLYKRYSVFEKDI